jgi:hypothetical protein
LTAENDAFTPNNKDQDKTHSTDFSFEGDEFHVNAGQIIQTNRSKQETAVVTNERPYAGKIYLQVEKIEVVTPSKYWYYGLQVGMVGPSARGYETQKQVHDWLDQGYPAGWNNQIRDEPTAHLIAGLNTEGPTEFLLSHPLASQELRVELGNDSTQLIGTNLLTWSFSNLDLYIGPKIFVVFKDIMLEGNTWKSSHGVDINRWKAEVLSGMRVHYSDYAISYELSFLSPEYVEEKGVYAVGRIVLEFKH